MVSLTSNLFKITGTRVYIAPNMRLLPQSLSSVVIRLRQVGQSHKQNEHLSYLNRLFKFAQTHNCHPFLFLFHVYHKFYIKNVLFLIRNKLWNIYVHKCSVYESKLWRNKLFRKIWMFFEIILFIFRNKFLVVFD